MSSSKYGCNTYNIYVWIVCYNHIYIYTIYLFVALTRDPQLVRVDSSQSAHQERERRRQLAAQQAEQRQGAALARGMGDSNTPTLNSKRFHRISS